MYTYIIEDGQFSEQIKFETLMVLEGMKTTIYTYEFKRKREVV